MQLLISSPWWFILLCLLAGFAYSYLLYKPQFKDLSHKVMAMFRFLSVSLLCFFLLGPVLVRFTEREEKPRILFVLDNSESIVSGKDKDYYKNDFLNKWLSLRNALGEDYEVEYLKAGSNIEVSDSADYKMKKTDLGKVFDYVNNTYAKQNIGAVILATDGIYNRGSNPAYKSLNRHTPLYTVGMGDSSIKKDLILKSANANSIAYLNNEYPIELNISAYECNGANTTLNIVSEGKTLHTQNISIDKPDFFKTVNVNLLADKPGSRHLIITLSSITGEHTVVNNRKDVFIDIIDGREKILLAFNGPHPDIGSIKEAVSTNKNYELISMPVTDVNLAEIDKFSVAILHQVPSRTVNSKNLISSLKSNNIPIWLIVGNQTAIEQLSGVSPQSRIDRNQGRYNESQAYFNDKFNAFTIDEITKSSLAKFPPLKVPYGQYAAAGGTEVLAYQKIGNVNTDIPLWAFSNQNGEKTAYLFGEGFWRWRMMDFIENESHFSTDELISKTIQYLTVKEDKRKFRVYPIKNVFEEDETVRFIAELYNASYEQINTGEVKLSLTNEEKKVFNYNFSKSGKGYSLDIGLIPPGNYTFSAKADGQTETINGKFLVSALQTELVNTRADFGLLRDMSTKHKGRFVLARDVDKIAELIKSNTDVTSVSYNEKKPEELIKLKWMFFILIALIAAEWFIRKYEGGY